MANGSSALLWKLLLVLVFFTAQSKSQSIGGILGIELNTTINCSVVQDNYFNSSEVQRLVNASFQDSYILVGDEIIDCFNKKVYINITILDSCSSLVNKSMNVNGTFSGYNILSITTETCSISSTSTTTISTSSSNTESILSLFYGLIIVAGTTFISACLVISFCTFLLVIIKNKIDRSMKQESGTRIQKVKKWQDDDVVLEDYQNNRSAPPPPPPVPSTAASAPNPSFNTASPPPAPPPPPLGLTKTLPLNSSSQGETNSVSKSSTLPQQSAPAPPPAPPLPPMLGLGPPNMASRPLPNPTETPSTKSHHVLAPPLPSMENKPHLPSPRRELPPRGGPYGAKPPAPPPVENEYDGFDAPHQTIEDIYDYGPELESSQDDLLNTEYINVRPPLGEYIELDRKNPRNDDDDDDGINEYVEMSSSGIVSSGIALPPRGKVTFSTNELFV